MTFETFATEELFSVAKKLADSADERIRAAAQAAADATRAEHERALADAFADANAAVAQARADAEFAMAQVRADADAAIAAARADAEWNLSNLRAQAAADAERAVADALAHAEMRLAELRAQDGGAAERLLEESALELSKARADADAELARVRAEAEAELARHRVATDAELASMRIAAEQEIASLRGAADTAARTNASYGAMIDKLRNEHTTLASENERLAAENAALTYERADIMERAQSSGRAPLLARLRATFRAIGDASSTDAALAAASRAIADDVPGACFRLQDHVVACVDPQGRVLESSDDEPAHLVELLRAHVALRLDRLAIEEKTAAELRAYAQMLIDEVEYVYDADSTKPETTRLERLTENLRCARQIFQQRVTVDGPANASLLEEVLERTRERKGAQPFAHDLGIAIHRSASPRSVAQAS